MKTSLELLIGKYVVVKSIEGSEFGNVSSVTDGALILIENDNTKVINLEYNKCFRVSTKSKKRIRKRLIQIKTFDLKSDLPTKDEAGRRLALIIRGNKDSKIIKVIHGYGSTGVGGVIKGAIHKSLRKRIRNNEISAYIPGEAFGSLLGFDEVITKYQNLLKGDSDYRKNNAGITYNILI